MADPRITKQIRRLHALWGNEEFGLWAKVKKAVTEVFIIVFGVSISIWLNDERAYYVQQRESKAFLLGLKSDLTNDISEMNRDIMSYQGQKATFEFLSSIKKGEKIERAEFVKHDDWLLSSTRLFQNNGRFEGFKSSGKISSIEDPQLQTAIMDLYQEDIPILLNSTDGYLDSKKYFLDFIVKNRKRTSDTTSNLLEILTYDEAYFISQRLADTDEVVERYTTCIDKMEFIVAKINELYPE